MSNATDGCWVQFYDSDGFQGGTKRFDGPTNVADMDDYVQSTGEKLGDEPDSLKTGTRTWLEVYKDDNYEGKTATFGPGSEINDLDAYGVGGNISSFRMYDEPQSWWVSSPNSPLLEADTGLYSSLTINDIARTLVGAALTLVPTVGSALRMITMMLWPESSNRDQAWACFQNYIDQIVSGIERQRTIDDLTKKLDGLYNLADDYLNAPPERRADTFENLLGGLRLYEPYFVDLSQTQVEMFFFIPYGTLMLFTFREQILSYQEIYGVPLSPEERQKLIDNLQNTIDAYQQALPPARQSLLDKRAAMVTYRDESTIGIGSDATIYVPIDEYTGWRGSQVHHLSEVEDAVAQRAEQVTNQLAYTLDSYLSTADLWSYINPDNPAPLQPPTIIYADGPYGQYQATPFSVIAADTQRITQVTISTGSLVDSLELFLNGTSTGRHGGSGGVPQTLALAEGETIIAAQGYASGLINQLGFTTSQGRSILGGGTSNLHFTSGPPEGTTGYLVGISGYSDNGSSSNANLKVVTFHWKCTLPFDTEPLKALGWSDATIALP
ncbi:MAG TPA: hypothetical protein VFZ66_02675 [Herpetosiphonaceae bacterium]